jgi:flagellar biosynthesis protein FlhF
MMGQPYVIKPDKKKTQYIFFLGSTGVGKTTTIAKIASKLKLEQGADVALVTADTYRIAAVEQLKTYANILSVPLKVIYSPDELGAMKEELDEHDICLVDTAGRSHKNKEQVEDIRKLIEQIPIADRQVYLVLNAGTKYRDLMEIASVYAELTDFSIIFTKLDETSFSGIMLNMKMKTKCPLSYVTWGQNVPDDIGEVDAQKVAKELLSGSLKSE